MHDRLHSHSLPLDYNTPHLNHIHPPSTNTIHIPHIFAAQGPPDVEEGKDSLKCCAVLGQAVSRRQTQIPLLPQMQ